MYEDAIAQHPEQRAFIAIRFAHFQSRACAEPLCLALALTLPLTLTVDSVVRCFPQLTLGLICPSLSLSFPVLYAQACRNIGEARHVLSSAATADQTNEDLLLALLDFEVEHGAPVVGVVSERYGYCLCPE